ncbi:MAG: DsbA family protein [Rhodocyclaceae bacterium]|nr:DsbA family protein [Rhodocyclaceae bacterium]MBL0076135.1 DsbA family protein [Rhodocyclaceae bacterium]MBP6108283.1 DsbA family protein [Rhodocyclaceae bacterium]MBP6278176.1 DsbA family protein [Rhodocyclaceae bacterium]
MSAKAVIGGAITSLITSPRLRDSRRSLAGIKRKLKAAPAQVHYFHQTDDPYSHLMLQVLPALLANYQIELVLHAASIPTEAAAPDRVRLEAWSRRDAVVLAKRVGLHFVDPQQQPPAALVARADQALVAAFSASTTSSEVLASAMAISDALWRSNATAVSAFPAAEPSTTAVAMEAGAALRQKLGHYLGGTLYFEGEWYWGIDRLQYLEDRLRSAGLARNARLALIAPVPRVNCAHQPTNGAHPDLHFFLSFRSPYTYIAVPRVIQMAKHYGANLQLRFILPMAMRGLPVPIEKRLYITRDTKREAESLGLRFGRIADPLGEPTERGLAVLHHAIKVGKGPEFALSFLQGVFADGIDAGSDSGLRKIAERAGVNAALVKTALADSSWREVAELNRAEMFSEGLWGVPSFRVDQRPAHWGQDRMWLIEQDLIAATAAVAKT